MAQAQGPDSPREAQPHDLLTPVQMETRRLLKAGAEHFRAHEETQALAVFKKAYVLSGSLPGSPTQAVCLFNLGAAYLASGKPQKALRCLQKARRSGRTGEDDADFCFNVAAAYEHMGKHRRAAEFYQKAIRRRSWDDPQGTGDALVKLAYCQESLGETASAAECFRMAGQAYQHAQLVEEAAMALREAARASLQSARGSPAKVLEILRACGQLCARIASQELRGKLYNDVGLHYVELRHFAEAEECFTEALACCYCTSGACAPVQDRAVLLQNLGAVCNARGHFARSLRYHSEAADLYGALGERQRAARAQSLYNLATAHGYLRNLHMAEFYFQQAWKTFAEAGEPSGEARVCKELDALCLCRRAAWAVADRNPQEAPGVFGKSKQETPEASWERIQEKLDIAGARAHASLGGDGGGEGLGPGLGTK